MFSFEIEFQVSEYRPARVAAQEHAREFWLRPQGFSGPRESLPKHASRLAEARKNDWSMAAAIVDGGSNLVFSRKWTTPRGTSMRHQAGSFNHRFHRYLVQGFGSAGAL
jgi:hypothetical protein